MTRKNDLPGGFSNTLIIIALRKMKNAGGRHSPAAYRRSARRRHVSGLMHSPVEVVLAVMAENFGVFS